MEAGNVQKNKLKCDLMKKTLLTALIILICATTMFSQAVYVDSRTGNDNNSGTKDEPLYSIEKAAEIIRSSDNDIYTMKINPGIYILNRHVSVATGKDMNNKRIIIEASILPDDTSWTPEKMPVIASRASEGEIPENAHFVTAFRIDESHVTIRGLKFHGYFYPHTRYNPVGRFDKTLTDLLVEQCVFVGDPNVSQLHVGIFSSGNKALIDHCVFFKVRNTVVFGAEPEGSGITNSIIYGACQAVWTAGPDKSFRFENNIVTNCGYVWVKNSANTTTNYSMNNCIIVNNRYFKGIPDSVRLQPGEFELRESNIIKAGEISLRLTGAEDKPLLTGVDKELPVDYMHIIPGTPGYEMGAGLFKKRE